MRSLHGAVCAVFLLAQNNLVFAESTLDFSIGSGWTSNIFKDPTALSAAFGEAKVALRGSLALEDSQLAYGLAASVQHVARYRFADQRTVGFELGYVRDIGEAIKLTLKGGIEHRRSGDIFISVPVLVGYRKDDIAAAGSAGVTITHNGGKSHLTASLSSLDRGKAHFTLPGVIPTQLEAGNRLYDLTGGHIRPLLGGEVGATVQYRTNHIDRAERRYGRFPAETLRGSLAYGRAFGKLTLLAEAGVVGVTSPFLGKSVQRLRPFLKSEASWQLPQDTVLKAKLGQDIQLADIDDALGEDVRTIGFSVEKALTEKLKLTIAFEQAYSDWLYYDYRTRTKSATATLGYTLAKGATLALEYSHLVRRESDKAADFKIDGIAARVMGSF
jgi:hypothetical protein